MTTGRVLAASPKSVSQISPGWGLIEQVQNFLFGGARACDVKDVVIGELNHLGDALSSVRRSPASNRAAERRVSPLMHP